MEERAHLQLPACHERQEAIKRHAEAADATLDIIARSVETAARLRTRPFIRAMACTVSAFGVAGLLGWILSIDALKSVLPGLSQMKPQTGFGFICAALYLWLATRPSRRQNLIGSVLLTIVACLGAVPLFESLTGIALYIERRFGLDPAMLPPGATARMSLISATEFVLFAAAMMAGRRETSLRNPAFVALSTAGLGIALMAIVGYLYDVKLLYEPIPESAIALHTSIAFFLLFLGVMASKPHLGWVALLQPHTLTSAFAVSLFPVLILGPIALGWLIFLGERRGYYGHGEAETIFAMASAAAVTFAVHRLGTFANGIGQSLKTRERMNAQLAAARAQAENAQTAAKASETRYRSMANISLDLIVWMDMKGIIAFVSPASEAMLGYSADEMIGTNMKDYIHPADLKGMQEFFTILVNEGPSASAKPCQYRAMRKDRRLVWLEGMPRVLFDSDGRPQEIQDFVRDITPRKALELALSNTQHAAARATQAKADFLANMSHEIRTPLNSIIGFSTLLSQSQGLSTAEKRYVELVTSSSRSLLTIVNDILDFSSLDAGGIHLEERAFSVASLAERSVETLRLQANAKNLSLTLKQSGALAPSHMGDEARLGQILINLIGNALKFTPSGGVEIHVLPKPPADGRQPLRFEVRDTGIGIPEEKLQFLFTRFTQADSSISRRFGGSGLGLSITKSLVDLMGGEIGVESLKGEGTTFWFTLELPIAAQTEKIRDEDVPTAQAAVRRRLLVVDDLDVNRELAAALLAPSGHQIDLAADGSEAIAFARANPYDLIFMDVQMPGMDGLTATRRIREMPRIARMPIVALTAQALPEQIAACRAAGMDDYLSKPFTPQGLMAMIAKWAGSGVAPAVSAPEEHQAEPEAEIDELDALRLRFLERTKQDAARIKVLLGETKDADFVELKSLVHRFAGSAGSFGFPEAGDVALALDQELARGGRPSPEAFGPLLSALDAALAA